MKENLLEMLQMYMDT